MASTREQAEAYAYENRRRTTSLIRGADEARLDPRRRLNRALSGGVAIGILIMAGFGIAGWLGGMRHFIAQFGECLSWPWTKLMDTPELNDELIDTIATQSDAQSGAYDVRQLERIRHANVAAILLALEQNDWGAGRTIAALR